MLGPSVFARDVYSEFYIVVHHSVRGHKYEYFYIDRPNILESVAFKRTIRKFFTIVAAHSECLRLPPMCSFETLFSCQCPFNLCPFGKDVST
jgi:hypothetical protein